LNRNDCVFNNSLISSPRTIIFRLLSFLQHWAVRVGDRRALEEVVEAMMGDNKMNPEGLVSFWKMASKNAECHVCVWLFVEDRNFS
jgi:hypothetical protein